MDGMSQAVGSAPTTRVAAAVPRNAGLLDRPRVTDRLRGLVGGALTLLSAPAGYGKSVVLDQWAVRHASAPIARVHLLAGDDAHRVTARLVAALPELGTALPHLPERLAGDGPGLGGNAVEAILAALAPVRRGVLVVDGLDAPVDAALVEDVRMLLGRLPAGVHGMAAQRSRGHGSPPSAGELWAPACLDEADLAFTADEAHQLVQCVAGRNLASQQVDQLLVATEGWPVVLHLAAIALRRDVAPEAVIEGLAHDERQLDGYIADEVLSSLPRRAHRFLTHTSVLDRMCGSLCDAVTRDPSGDGEAMLRQLYDCGLHLRQEDTDGKPWFRLHPQVREVLRRALRRSDPSAEPALLASAAAWHVARDETETAFGYLVDAGDGPGLVQLVDRCGRTMFERGAAEEVLRWLDTVPGSRDPRQTGLAMRRAYLHTMVGQMRLADQVVHDIDSTQLSPGERIALDALRATWAFRDGQPLAVIDAADAVLVALDGIDPPSLPDIFGLTTRDSLRLMATGSRARAWWYLGKVEASRRALAELCREHGAYPPWRVRLLGTLALVEAWAGNLCAAQRSSARGLAVAAAGHLLNHPASLDARLAAAHVARERGDLDRAEELLSDVQALATRFRVPVALAMHSLERARYDLARGHPEQGLAEIRRNRARGDPPPPPAVAARERAAEAQLLVALGNTVRARSILEEAAAAGLRAPEVSAASVQVAVERGDLGAAAAHLEAWHPDPAVPRAVLERDLWAAVVAAQGGDARAAHRRIARVVADAEAEGHVRLFLDASRPAWRLLRALHHASSTPYLRQLIAGAQSPLRGMAGDAPAGLSHRELEIVRYLPTPLSNAEIAAALYVSVNTLKTHLRTIYRKLGVANRRDAITRAEDLGIA
jgi:LuxR family transcriptional regulator, maltose regulon positive regulatory protein